MGTGGERNYEFLEGEIVFMVPTIQIITEKKLVGRHLEMSLSDNQTFVLWNSFMKEKDKIQNAVGTDLYSMQVYGQGYFEDFNPTNRFVKWAAVEVSDFDSIPDGMEGYLLQGGLYAVFIHRGGAATGVKTFEYIFKEWLPGSNFVLDDREHFEVLGSKYKEGDASSEEEIWIPIKAR